ncbi:MAG: peptidoglycan bridge formation glycyltransferase FemA/FemB family protein [Bacteroidota bacterium]|nr:peptidoglycan bridge formation glycyltransferase FemA/FemB family protein [Bacteroidota bacterium]
MDVEISPKETEAMQLGPILPQTAYWARLKEKHGYRTIAFDIKSELPGRHLLQWKSHTNLFDDLLVVIRRISDDASIAYVPYGPTTEPDTEYRGPLLEALAESLRPHLPGDCILLRFDLPWQSPWMEEEDAYDENGNWAGPPEARVQEMRMNFETCFWNLFKAPSDILPAHTIFLDLSKDRGEILKSMKAKTRYNIRLSQKKGVNVKLAGREDLPIWYSMYKETTWRNHIIRDDMDYFNAVIKTRASESASPARPMLLLASDENTPLAGMLMTIAGGRATYLYGASASVKRNKMASYALQWKAISIAKEAGCVEYDMFGVAEKPHPSHPMYGLYRFKSGFGGDIFHRQGCWDYPFDQNKYREYKIAEMHLSGYHN